MPALYLPTSLAAQHDTVAVTSEAERPEWLVTPPDHWEAELRAVSPIVEKTSHLRFRYFAAHHTWVLYECTPKALLDDFRREQLSTPAAFLKTKGEQVARSLMVSDYQHYMYRVHGVEACPYLILQGPFGGTPTVWNERERKILHLNGLPEDVPVVGMFAPCEWGHAVLDAIAHRDRLRKAEMSLARLEWTNSAPGIKAEVELAEQEYRKGFLAYWQQTMAPIADHILSLRQKKATRDFASDGGTRDGLTKAQEWMESFVDTGTMPTMNRGARSTRGPLITSPVAV